MDIQKFSDLLQFQEIDQSNTFVWADFLCALGYSLASAEPKQAKIILILPVIDVAAPLLAFGYLYGKFHKDTSNQLTIDTLRTLKPGINLIYRSSTGPLHAVFEGITTVHDKEFAVVRTESKERGRKSSGGSHLLQPHQLNKISIVSKKEKKRDEKDIGKNVAGIAEFAKLIYGQENIGDISPELNSTWMIGRFAEIENELQNIPLKSRSIPNAEGNFQDLLRADQYLKPREPAFSRIVSGYRHDVQFNASPASAGVCIFREGASYLKQHHKFTNASKIVVMDFADQNLEHVIGDYNQDYYNRIDDLSFDFDFIPRNVVCAGFWENNK